MNLKIEDYLDELEKNCCGSFKPCKKCKDHKKLCFTKKFVWRISSYEYKRRVKKGLIK